jgi:hypothetical protein
MKALLIILPSLGLAAELTPPKRSSDGLALKAVYELAADPLTTENAWILDPTELNPHRQRWLLERDVRLKGVEAVPAQGGRFAARITELSARTRLYVRDPGPWYRPFTDFRCDPEPASWFSTREGALVAGKAAAEAWEAALGSERVRLAVRLERVSAQTAEGAEVRAHELFHDWLREVEAEWSVKGRSKARMAEWRYYLEQAAQAGMCKDQHTAEAKARRRELPPPPRWEELMDPVRGPARRRLLARAPARRWDGLFTVKATIDVGTHTLVGQFLVDSGAALSVLSPDWLTAQGANPVLLELQGLRPQRVTWAGGSGVARRAMVFSAAVSGYTLPFAEFLLMGTELFAPPEYLASCCDGILGADFLRHFAVELDPGPPAAMTLYAREGFQLAAGTPWIEVASTPRGEPISSCVATPKGGGTELVGVRWDTGTDVAVEVHAPWEKAARSSKGPWELSCGGVTLSERVPLTYPEPEDAEEGSPLASKLPGMNAGMALLGRGPITLDLSHGRIWFSPKTLAAPVRVNETGLELEFVETKDGDRELRVAQLRPGPLARRLARSGVVKGTRVTLVDGKFPDELDLWEIEQRLAGAYGEKVKLRWRTAQGKLIDGEIMVAR